MTTENQSALRSQLVSIIENLRTTGANDGEAMFLLGGGANRLRELTDAPTWTAFKAKLQPVDVARLLKDMDAEGNAMQQQDKAKHAYALRALAVSLATTGNQVDVIQGGAILLDQIIEETLVNYRNYVKQQTASVN
ncbi:hypothetical protein [Devosia sp. 2618]|uniref:hypothetical protein n=1 Tax=Devosia sp. 2618 TaxID=3156454 RepID=UPI003392781C